jgi:hypothetical protein
MNPGMVSRAVIKSKAQSPKGRQARDEPMRRALINLGVVARFGRHGLS